MDMSTFKDPVANPATHLYKSNTPQGVHIPDNISLNNNNNKYVILVKLL